MTRTVHVTVRGRVQGVGYRAWTADTARSLGLAGHVRNRRDGAVEALLHGPAEVVGAMLARMRDGPPAARVDDLRTEEGAGERPEGFAVLPTA
jgi:acylphosphatase